MSGESGGHPPNRGQEGPLQPIDGLRARPNVVSAGQQQQGAAEPPPQSAIDLWNEVAENLDRNSTVVWAKAVESLESARRHLQPPSVSPNARSFVDARMTTIISILLEQQPGKIGPNERDCVEKSVRIGLTIVRDDLEAMVAADGSSTANDGHLQGCNSLSTLHHILARKKTYYKSNKTNWSSQPQGMPEVRTQMISTFKRLRGFHYLGLFLQKRSVLPKELQTIQHQQNQPGSQTQAIPIFPQLDTIHVILEALKDAILAPGERANDDQPNDDPFQEDVLRVINAVKSHLLSLDEETLKRLNPEAIRATTYHLQRLYEKMALRHPHYINEYYEFSRSLVLKLITSASLPLKLLGWGALEEIIDASIQRRPPPKSYVVEGAGLEFINGKFDFDPKRLTEEGWIKNGCDAIYVRKIPESNANPASAEDGAGKTLTLFRCTMRSQQKWWFISEADEDQPGTDKDIDYYNHKSKQSEENLPSACGWLTCRSGVDPPPTLRPVGLMVPPGEEESTLECVLAKWAIENRVIELVLGDSIHREIVARSTALIRFLANMCDNDDDSLERGDVARNDVASPMQTETTLNPYCLQLSHLLLAWKTCTSKTDAAVSAEIYNLLVSILPSLPEELAIPLLQAIHSEVNKGNHNFLEVSEFCCAIAKMAEGHYKNNNAINIKSRVREEILGLQWAILTHEDARSLKSYESIKKYVNHEICQTDTIADSMRNRFLLYCREVLIKHSGNQASAMTNETHALHMVQLTGFVLESYPRDKTGHALMMAANEKDKKSLADLILMEMMAFLNRRKFVVNAPPVRKPSSASVALPDFNYSSALSSRLQIMNYVYGLSTTAEMTSQQVDNLWSLCTLPVDREAIMSFLSDATVVFHSNGIALEIGPENNKGQQTVSNNQTHAVFSREVSIHAFENLFCSANVRWECLGQLAFMSFKSLFTSLQHGVVQNSAIKERAIDALWRICLTAGNEHVATNAMDELLNVYVQSSRASQPNEASDNNSDHIRTESNDGASFSKRIFDCLCDVQKELQRGNSSSLRSAERCIKILKRAFDLSTLGGGAIAVAERLRSINGADTLDAYTRKIPHGIRGVSSCVVVSVLTKKTGSTGSDRFSMEIHLLQSFGAIKDYVAKRCDHDVKMMKLTNITGRPGSDGRPPQRPNFSAFSDTAVAADLGISEGNELVFMLGDKVIESGRTTPSPNLSAPNDALDLDNLLNNNSGSENSFGIFFDTLIAMLESLPTSATTSDKLLGEKAHSADPHTLVWDVLMTMPTNTRVCNCVQKAAVEWKFTEPNSASDAMAIDSAWASLLDTSHFERSVYVLQVLDFSLRPPPYLFSCLPPETAQDLSRKMRQSVKEFQTNFIRSGGFEAVLRLFVESGTAEKKTRRRMRMGNEFSLRILSTCFFGIELSPASSDEVKMTKEGLDVIKTFPKVSDFLTSLMNIVIDDKGVADAAILKVLRLIEAMLKSDKILAASFAQLPERITERFLTSLLLYEGSISSIKNAAKIRKKTEDMILETPLLSSSALPFLVRAMNDLNPLNDCSNEFFSAMMKLVSSAKSQPRNELIDRQMEALGTATCNKLASYPRPTSDNEHIDYSTGVLCGCLNVLLSLIDLMGGCYLQKGSRRLLKMLMNDPWCDDQGRHPETVALINVIGTIFDCFVSSSQSPGTPPLCCDKKSRQLAFRVVVAATQACNNGEGYQIIVSKIGNIMSHVVPPMRHIWSHSISHEDGNSHKSSTTSKYSGLKNQGCTCYMNSFLQQLFMMPALRNSLCSAKLPSSLRSSGGGVMSEGQSLVGKKISLHWDCGNNYDAVVDHFDEKTGMHTVRYLPIQLSTQQHQPPDLSQLPDELPEQFILREGRPNRETGAFEILNTNPATPSANVSIDDSQGTDGAVSETEDEASSRKLLEEVQRTFVNLDEARGRCFDPRTLVEASNCLKLEFDVWQQNDASEFAMKLLDRLEISLKRWSPSVFKYLAHTFGLKTTKQKICKECGLKSSREENMMNIDCQIRNKSTIHEALSTLCEDEIMEGDNKVLCDRCKVKTNTVLRTAISALPDVLILSLKRFDLDYTTFETVKLNSRCEFEEALNMKQYTLEAKELLEATVIEDPKSETGSMMDIEDEGSQDPLSKLPDEDYEYRLVGVLVHAGVAQGGHYYSFIKDRTSNKWYRFDDEDVTPFDPALIEQECFGGKVKKETKYPNGHVHTTENEQFANALMLLYEKTKPVKMSDANERAEDTKGGSPMEEDQNIRSQPLSLTNGYDAFLPSVTKSNSMHSWQSFLLTPEFQCFMSDVLSHSINQTSNDIDANTLAPPQIEQRSWQYDVIQLSLSFVFDLLLHVSVDKNILESWSAKIGQIFMLYPIVTEAFVSNLAHRTRCVHENWIRAYTVECSDEQSRRTALQIFTTAIRKQLGKKNEQRLLQEWIRGLTNEWSRIIEQIRNGQHVAPMIPESSEDVSNIGTTATSIGAILSFVTVLLELCPRFVQTRVELFYFIELLAKSEGSEGQLLRLAMSRAQIPVRLLCLAWREKFQHNGIPHLRTLRALFPGVCLSSNLAIGLCKHESQNILQMGVNNAGMNGGGNQFTLTRYGVQLCMEAFACLIGVPYCVHEDITYDTGEIIRGRSVIHLTPLALEAFTAVYEESKASSSKGMTKREIQDHMKRCGIRDIPPQRIDQIINKHAVVDDAIGGTKVLPLEGFLDHYQSYACQNDETKLLQELQLFGFRPNLSRMKAQARFYTDEATGKKCPLTLYESIATDVVLNQELLTKHLPFLDLGIWNPHFLWFTLESNRIMAQYIHAALTYVHVSDPMIIELLRTFHNPRNVWNSDICLVCRTGLCLLAAMPDNKQQERIHKIMMNNNQDDGDGLLICARQLHQYATDDQQDSLEKVMHMLHELRKQRAVAKWMEQNRDHCAWLEPGNGPEMINLQQSRGDYSVRRGGADYHQSTPTNQLSDYEDDDDDDDDDFEDDDSHHNYNSREWSEVTVQDCGVQSINGVYKRVGHCDNVPKYSKVGLYEGNSVDFMLFRCKLSDGSRRWYISIVPGNIHPGTTKDIDFYFATSQVDSPSPPEHDWSAIPQRGLEPPPRVIPYAIDGETDHI